MSASGAVADWQLAAPAVVIGNGKNWVESRQQRKKLRSLVVNEALGFPLRQLLAGARLSAQE